MSELIQKYEMLLQVPITPDNILLLKEVLDAIKADKTIHLGKVENERLDFIEGRKQWLDIYKYPTDDGVEINLIVLDKESIPTIKAFKRYILGYALDSTKPQDGENLVPFPECVIADNFQVGSIVAVKVRGVKPVKNGKFYSATINAPPLSYTAKKDKLHCAKEIIRKAYDAGVLEMDKALAIDLCKTGILSFDIDKHFGVSCDKFLRMVKGPDFMKEGIVYGIVYPVNEVDADGDYALPEEVQKACWRFMEDFQKFNYMHADDLSARDVALVECACSLADVPNLGIKKGDWYIAVKVYNLDIKKKIESGEISGFSMEGSAQPGIPVEGMTRR